MCVHIHRRQRTIEGSFLSPCEAQAWTSSGHEAWQQVSSPLTPTALAVEDSVLRSNACQLLSSELGKQDGFCLYTEYLAVRDGNLSAAYPL